LSHGFLGDHAADLLSSFRATCVDLAALERICTQYLGCGLGELLEIVPRRVSAARQRSRLPGAT
jgi:DNA-binding Xre family transcriptional regulator